MLLFQLMGSVIQLLDWIEIKMEMNLVYYYALDASCGELPPVISFHPEFDRNENLTGDIVCRIKSESLEKYHEYKDLIESNFESLLDSLSNDLNNPEVENISISFISIE